MVVRIHLNTHKRIHAQRTRNEQMRTPFLCHSHCRPQSQTVYDRCVLHSDREQSEKQLNLCAIKQRCHSRYIQPWPVMHKKLRLYKMSHTLTYIYIRCMHLTVAKDRTNIKRNFIENRQLSPALLLSGCAVMPFLFQYT